MTEEEFVTAFRWVLAALIILIVLSACPPLVSAPSDFSVLTGIVGLIAGVVATAAAIAGRLDNILKDTYRVIRDKFFN